MGKIIPFPSPPEQEEILTEEEKYILHNVWKQLETLNSDEHTRINVAALAICFMTASKKSQEKIFRKIQKMLSSS